MKFTNTPFILSILAILLITSCSHSKARNKEGNSEKTLSYRSVSFNYDSDWEVKAEDSSELVYYIECREIDASLFFISVVEDEANPEDMLNRYFESLENRIPTDRQSTEKSKFGKYECLSSNYTLMQGKVVIFGIAYSFTTSNKTFLIVKQSSGKENIENEKYKQIENSFRVGENE